MTAEGVRCNARKIIYFYVNVNREWPAEFLCPMGGGEVAREGSKPLPNPGQACTLDPTESREGIVEPASMQRKRPGTRVPERAKFMTHVPDLQPGRADQP